MKNQRSASVTRTISSSADISEQNKKLFENAGNDIKPIRLKSGNDVMKEIEFLETHIDEDIDWDEQVRAMQRAMALVNGGATEFENFTRGLNRVYSGLISAATNLRSALVKQSCLFIAQLAREIGPSIDLVGDFIIPLSSQLSHGTQIIAESCKFAILCISKNCYSRKVLKSIFDLCNSRAPAVKAVAAESLSNVILYWPSDFLTKNLVQIESFLQKLLSDGSVNTRAFAREAAKAYQMNFSQRAKTFISKLDQRTQKSITECTISTDGQRKKQSFLRNTNNSDILKDTKRPNQNEQNVKTQEKVDIASNPPRMLRPKKVENEYENFQKPKEVFQATANFARNRRAPSMNNIYNRRRQSLSSQRDLEDFDEPVINAKRKSAFKEDLDVRQSKKVEADSFQDFDEKPKYKSRLSYQPRLNQSQKLRPQQQRYTEEVDDNDDDYVQPQNRESQKFGSQTAKFNRPKYSNQQNQNYQMNEPVKNSENLYKLRYSHKEEDEFAPTIKRPKRQASVQPQKVSQDFRRNVPYDDEDDISGNGQQKIVEKKQPIRLISGEEKDYLLTLQTYVDEDRISELATSMSYISRDLVNCCGNKSAVISSQALQILFSILPIYAPHFRSILPSLVETVLEQAEIGNPRSANTAKQILNELHRSFDSNTLLLICTSQPPSVPLLNFTDSLVSLNDVDIGNDTICQKLLMLAFKCYNIGSISNRRTAARITEHVHQANSLSLKKFTDSLRDQQLKQFDEFIKPYLPNIQIKSTITEIPRYNPKNPKAWIAKIENLLPNLNGADWIELRPQLYTEFDEALRDKKEAEICLNIILKLFSTRDVEDFQILLPSLFINIREKTSELVDSILTIIVHERDPAEVFESLQNSINNSDPQIARAALGFQTLLISKIDKNELRPLISSLIPGLTKGFESQVPEVRKAVVLCFVELYAQFDKDLIDRHTSHLNKGQQKLIGIYLNRRKK